MPNHIRNIVERINQLQDELEVALAEKAEQFSYSVENRRIKFKSDTVKWQKQFKRGVPKYILGNEIPSFSRYRLLSLSIVSLGF